MINSSIVEELGIDIFQQAITIFLRNCEVDINTLNQGFKDKNIEIVKDLSHKLIGTFGSVRVEQIPELLRIVNQSSVNNILEEETFEKVKVLYLDLKIYIKDNFSIETQS